MPEKRKSKPTSQSEELREQSLAALKDVYIDDLTMDELSIIFPRGNPAELKVTLEEWVSDWAAGVEAMADRWKRRTVGTRKDVIKLGALAEPKFKSKMQEALRLESRRKALEKTSTEEWRDMVEVTDAGDYSTGATKRQPKFRRKTELQYPMREYAKARIDAMPEETDAQRERRLVAAKRTNVIIGNFMKGIIDAATCRREIDAQTPTGGV